MNTLSSVDDPQTSGWARWRWFSQWPVVATIAFILVIFLLGSRLMGSYRWVQTVVGTLWIVWLLFEITLHPDAPQRRGWSRRRRIVTTGMLILALVMNLVFFYSGW